MDLSFVHFPNPIMNPSVLFGFWNILWQEVPCCDCAYSINQIPPAVCLLPDHFTGCCEALVLKKEKIKGSNQFCPIHHLFSIHGSIDISQISPWTSLLHAEDLNYLEKSHPYLWSSMSFPKPLQVPPPAAFPASLSIAQATHIAQ